MSVIPESGMNFGKYDEKDLFHIETSEIYKKLGDGIPTVEFILKYNENNIVFLDNLRSVSNMKDVKLKFILVVKNAEDITWLAGPLAELRARLLKVRKIWGVEVVVLNEELAGEYNLTC